MYGLNPDDVASNAPVSVGPAAGIIQSAQSAYEGDVAQTAGGQQGDILDSYYKQSQQLRDLGEKSVPELGLIDGPDNSYLSAKELQNVYNIPDGQEGPNEPQVPWHMTQVGFDMGMKRVQGYNDYINDMKAKYPDANLQTMPEIVQGVNAQSKAAALAEDQRRGTTAGSIGGVIGDLAAQINPAFHPANTLALVAGAPLAAGAEAIGIPASLATRVAVQGVAQGGATALEEATGAPEAREMIGLDGSVQGSLQRIGESAAGGVALGLVHEGATAAWRAAGKRWFNTSATDPAPMPTPDAMTPSADPYAPTQLTPEQQFAIRQALPNAADPELAATRMGTGRVLQDLGDVTDKLQDWNGDDPINLKPGMDTADVYSNPEGVRYADDVTTRRALGSASADDIARTIDPDAFRVYDGLQDKITEARAELEATQPGDQQMERAQQISGLTDNIQKLTDQIGDKKVKGPERAQLMQQRDEAMATRDALQAQGDSAAETPRTAELRQTITDADEKRRSMAPTISRAYARARGEFQASQKTKAAVSNMIDRRASGISPEDAAAIVQEARTGANRPPAQYDPLADGPTVSRAAPEDVRSDKPLVFAAKKVVEGDEKTAKESLDTFRGSLRSVLDDEKGTITIGSQEYKLSDKMKTVGLDGTGERTITIRDLLNEVAETDEDLQAMKSCSI